MLYITQQRGHQLNLSTASETQTGLKQLQLVELTSQESKSRSTETGSLGPSFQSPFLGVGCRFGNVLPGEAKQPQATANKPAI